TIKTLAAGVGALAGSTVLPDTWVTPVIQGIALPVHAQTSAPGITFCNERIDLTLVDGHSGTDEMTIEASGCITPAQANVELELTLEGYSSAIITRNEKDSGTEGESFLTAVSQALVPSAHATAAPVCSLKVNVKTDANGNFKASFKLKCGKGIVQVVLNGSISGVLQNHIGWLDIHGCNPCESQGATESSLTNTTAYSFTNNSSGTVTVEWEGLRTDSIGPDKSVEAPEGTDEFTNIWVTGTNYIFSCPNIPICFSGTYGGEMSLVINDCGGQVAISDCPSAPTAASAAAPSSSGRNYAW
ncbi:MAG: hypothetical protein D3909_18235, partial [Candidatus Electrothrix sp. ATG1]|nr:hypothetical protein [Candidatus Electrothrix sp. ATG1]